MKKLLRNIALLLLPVVAYFGVFIAFEPNNYFGLRAQPLGGSDIIARLRQYEKQPGDFVMVGDSRLAYFDMEAAEEYAGVAFENLCYGGASLMEELDLLEWLLEKNSNMDTVVLGLSFYTLNSALNHDRMVVKALRNPLVYMTNLTYNINMLETLYVLAVRALRGEGPPAPGTLPADGDMVLGGGQAETRDPASYTWNTVEVPVTGGQMMVRTDLASYALNDLQPRVKLWALNDKAYGRLLEMAADCAKAGVQLVVALPPVEDSVHTLLTEPYGIEAPMHEVVNALRKAGATVLDYEFTERPAWGHEMFYDGFHPDYERGLPAWTELLFSDVKKAMEA